MNKKFDTIGNNIKQLAILPAHRVSNNEQGDEVMEQVYSETLSSNPKNLFVLWQEYEFGISGRKPARDFTAKQRGKTKHKYFRRKAFWEVVAEMVRGGMMAEAAIDRVYLVYGRNKSITKILNKMINDKKRNFRPPQLQI